MKTCENKLDVDQRDWSGLCDDMLHIIISSPLFLDDIKNFHLTCKSWSLIHHPPALHPMNFPVPTQSQWLLCIGGSDGTQGKFFHPLCKEPYVKNNIPELSGATIRFANNGWLLMTKGKHLSFFFNPFTSEVIYLPKLHRVCNFMSMAFTFSPTSPNCMVFGIDASDEGVISICTILHGEKIWEEHHDFLDTKYHHVDDDEEKLTIALSSASPVLHNGKFYILGEHGNIGALVCRHDEKYNNKLISWRVFQNLQPPCDLEDENFLVECDGCLFLVILESKGSWISILKLNEALMIWETVESLGDDHMFFLSSKTSFSRKKSIQGMQDQIFFPFIHKDCVVSYSLKKQRYGTIANSFSSDSLCKRGQPLFCCWIEPKFDSCSKEELDWLVLPS